MTNSAIQAMRRLEIGTGETRRNMTAVSLLVLPWHAFRSPHIAALRFRVLYNGQSAHFIKQG